ncbi:MAG: MFS transporter [Deltaproteobacteria bacterium]|jgi:FSR family fosmidomycin resistance protein-like MFS transporter
MKKIPLLLLFLGHVWVDASQAILPVALVKLKALFSLSYFQAGFIMAVLNLTSSVIQPAFGYISDRVSTGWFVPAGILWTALAMGLLGWSINYPVAVLLVGLAGLGTAAFHPRAMMDVYTVSGSRLGFGAALFTTGGNVGFALGPVVGSFLVLGFGLHATLGLLAPAVLLCSTIFFYRREFLSPEPAVERESSENFNRATGNIPWGSLVALCLIVTLRSWVYISFITYLPMFFQTQGIQLKTGSMMLTVFLIGGAVAGLYGGHLSDKVGRKGVIAVSMLIYPVLASLMIKSNGGWIWLLAGASGAALLASFAVTIVLAQELMPQYLGLASGLILGLGFGTGGLGTALSGFLADRLGLYQVMWILALSPVLGAALAAFIRTGEVKNRKYNF